MIFGNRWLPEEFLVLILCHLAVLAVIVWFLVLFDDMYQSVVSGLFLFYVPTGILGPILWGPITHRKLARHGKMLSLRDIARRLLLARCHETKRALVPNSIDDKLLFQHSIVNWRDLHRWGQEGPRRDHNGWGIISCWIMILARSNNYTLRLLPDRGNQLNFLFSTRSQLFFICWQTGISSCSTRLENSFWLENTQRRVLGELFNGHLIGFILGIPSCGEQRNLLDSRTATLHRLCCCFTTHCLLLLFR